MLRFAERRPLGYTLLLWVAMLVIYMACGTAVAILHLSNTAMAILSAAGLALFAFVLVGVNGWWHEVGFNPLRQKRDWLYYLIPLALPIINLSRGFQATDVTLIATFLLAGLLTGLAEELYFRGVIVRALLPKGTGWAVLGSAVLFGIPHILNSLQGQSLGASLVQIAYALVVGIAFSLVRLRTRAVWPMMIVHALNNFFAWTGEPTQVGSGSIESATDLLAPLGIVVLFGAYAIYLWRSQPRETAAPGQTRAAG